MMEVTKINQRGERVVLQNHWDHPVSTWTDDELAEIAARIRQKEEQLLKIGATTEAPFPRR